MASESAPYKNMMRTRDDGSVTVMGDDDRERIYVPPQRRMELYKLTHSGIGHLAAAKTYAELTKNYDWPTMRRDVRKWYKDCTFCELSKAKRYFANKKWGATEASPPRLRWGIDFYGMPDYEILGMIDMDSLHVELAACETRQQTNVEAAIEEHILFRHGVPDEIRSDHAREFIGTVMTALLQRHGFSRRTTGGYMPQGNSTIKRFWDFLALCLRGLSDTEYTHSKRFLPAFRWAWNTSISESLSVRPFEVMTGASPRSAADAVLPRTEGTGAPLKPGEIRVSAEEFTRIAAAHADHMRKQRRDALNRHGRKMRELDVGDQVKIFVPPSIGEVTRSGRKQKHLLRWRGPLTIVARPSVTTYKLEDRLGKKYMRHLANIRPWRGPMPDVMQDFNLIAPLSSVDVLHEDEYILACERVGDDVYHLLKVKEVMDQDITAQVYGTTGKKLSTAKFTPVYTRGDDVILRRYSQVRGAQPWTWTLLLEDIDELILAQGIILSKHGKLNADSRRIIQQLRPRTMKVFS
jgi:hypothetical protein